MFELKTQQELEKMSRQELEEYALEVFKLLPSEEVERMLRDYLPIEKLTADTNT